MLRSLYIQNYALIEKLDISFSSGFSVITGETGAGKSIILGAIGLLLGQRADVKAIRVGASKCIIEARFDISAYGMQPFFEENELEYEEECILRREVSASGKSRAFINDTPASLAQMKELGEQLIDVHSQHQNLLLNKEGFQLNVLDILSHNEEALSAYQHIFGAWKQAQQDLEALVARANQDKSDEDYIRFQLEQLEEAHLSAGEQEELEQEADTLSHAEEIKAGLYRVGQTLYSDEGGLLSGLKECLNTMLGLQRVYPVAGELAERMESTYIELKDISQEVSGKEDEIEFNPERLDEVNERLNLIYTLQQKHRVSTVGELLALTDEYAAKLSAITSSDEHIEELKARCDALYNKVKKQAAVLTKARTAAAREVEKQMAARLVPLGMPNVRFQVEIGARKEPGIHGADTVNFLFSANKNGALQSVSSVASGGEIARVMLSIKAMIAGAVKLPTIVFDEIDTGVSGEIADRMADIMQEMGEQDRQVISITHLPQIAARGCAHYKVYKQDNETETNSHIRRLTDDERVEEIAHMLSGAKLTEAALNNARALLEVSNSKYPYMVDNSEMIFGVRAVIEAIQAGKEIDKILVKKDIQSDLSKELFAVLKGTLIPVQRVPVERINRVTRKNHQGVIAFISSVTYQKTEDLVPFLFEQGKNPLFVMLDGITDVRNFGAIARTCECAAVDAVIIPARNSVSVNADAMKTSAGALHTLPVCREHSLKETLQFLKNSGFHIVAATEKGDYDYTKADYTGPMCIIMGAEDKGVSYDNLALCDEWVKIPMLGTIESLNVSVAAGILIYEAVKQRTN